MWTGPEIPTPRGTEFRYKVIKKRLVILSTISYQIQLRYMFSMLAQYSYISHTWNCRFGTSDEDFP